ncbi:MAG TPA: hypothetical protein VJM31_15400 [Vicinamibacterales bacterium]|nr:hypothetical protein [Vicinamibacterales bacterium]
MRRFISALVTVAIVSSSVALGAQQRDAVQRSRDFWFAHASRLTVGSTIRVRTIDGRRVTAVLAIVDAEGITLEPKTRVAEPPYRIRFEHLQELELKQAGGWIGATIGAAAGVGTFLGLLAIVFFTGMD